MASEQTGTVPYATPSAAPSRPRRLPRVQELGLVIVILLLGGGLTFAGHSGTSNTFLNPGNLLGAILTPMSMTAVMAIGMTAVIITGGIDISVASIYALSALGAVYVLQDFSPDAPWWQTIPVGFTVPMLIGLACGLINGGLIVGLRLHPFIVTLGTMGILRGLCNVLVPLKTLPAPDKAVPDSFASQFFQWQPHGASLEPVAVFVMAAWVIAGMIYLGLTVAGRQNYAIGGNEEASRYSGLPVGRIKLRVYALMGLSAGLAGAISAGYYGSASSNTGLGLELSVIAAAVVGGASLSGGRGTALGALLGTLVIKLIDNGIFILHFDTQYSDIIVGIAIIVAASVDRMSEQLRERRLARAATFTPTAGGSA